jgi:hypothetical protein
MASNFEKSLGLNCKRHRCYLHPFFAHRTMVENYFA